MKNRVRAMFRDYTFFEACDDYDKGVADVLLIDRGKLGVRDRGEVEALVQAAQVGAIVIVDDRWGRTLAARHGRDSHGTLWVLRRLLELGLTSSATTRDRLVALFRRGVRLPRKEVNAFLVEIGESPIAADDNRQGVSQ
jgi:predicted nucleic acid-binding protein